MNFKQILLLTSIAKRRCQKSYEIRTIMKLQNKQTRRILYIFIGLVSNIILIKINRKKD